MENLEPKTRMEFFLNNIAEAVSGEGGGGGSIDMSSLILDPTEFQPLVIDGSEWDYVWVSDGEGGKDRLTNVYIYDFQNEFPIFLKEENESGISYDVLQYRFGQLDPCVVKSEGDTNGAPMSEPYLVESTSATAVFLANDDHFATIFPSTAKFELWELQ